MTHAQEVASPSQNHLAVSATTHCLTGCAIGEVLGMVIGTALGWVAAFPVNRWLIARGRGHAVVHEHLQH